MLRSRRTGDYRKMLEDLPPKIQEAALDAYAVFCEDPFHPILENHSLHDNNRGRHRAESRAVNVTRRYRAIYVVEETNEGPLAVWYWIGSHEAYNNLIG